MIARYGLCLLLLALGGPAAAKPQAVCGPLTPHDAAQIRQVIETYRDRWLAGDAEGVLRTFSDQAVLLPPQSAAPVVGRAAISRFWWPPGSPATPITKLHITFEEIGGDCQVGYARGLDEVEWTVGTGAAAKTRGNSGTYLNVMRKGSDGAWRISHHMWDDDPARRR